MATNRGFWRSCQLSTLILLGLFGLYFYSETVTYFFGSRPQTSEHQIIPTNGPVLSWPPPTTRHPLSPPYPYPYKFLLNAQEKCQNRNPFLVIMVIGHSYDINSRFVIRETWGNESNYEDVGVVTVFLVGLSPTRTESVQEMLKEENDVYGDLVQQDFMDTYYNLTLKTLMGMEWVTKFCPSVSYVMKIDNDMFLNVDFLIHHLLMPGLPVRKNYFTGYIVRNTRPLRDKQYKWYVPKEVYPNDTYPPYCSGPGYAFSGDMAKKIYEVAQVIRVMPMEDAFMGICLYELNIPPTDPPGGIFNGHRINYDRCKFHKLVTVHHYEGNELRDVWKDFWGKKKSGCPEKEK
ncbi:beta-1,3-galactosyltransferase 2-like [Rhinophrynus dorsalis]